MIEAAPRLERLRYPTAAAYLSRLSELLLMVPQVALAAAIDMLLEAQ